MNIQWNRVTWYSQVIAILLALGIFGSGIALGMYIDQTKMITVQPAVAPTSGTATSGTDNSSDNGKVIADVTYKCDAGKTIRAIYTNEQVQVLLSDGRNLTLPQTVSADGGRYANKSESFVFWSKGTGAFVEEGTSSAMTYANCTQMPAPIQ